MTQRQIVPLISASYDCMPSKELAIKASKDYCKRCIDEGKEQVNLLKRFPGSPVKQELPIAGVRIVDLSTYQLAAHNIEHYVVGNDNIGSGGELLCSYLGNTSQQFVDEGPLSGLSRANTYIRAYERIGPGIWKMIYDHPADTFLARILRALANPKLLDYDIVWPLNSLQTNGQNVDRNWHMRVIKDGEIFDIKEGNGIAAVFDIIAMHPLGFDVVRELYGARKSFGRKILDIPRMLTNVAMRDKQRHISVDRVKGLYEAFGEEGRQAVKDYVRNYFKGEKFTIPIKNLEAIMAHASGVSGVKVNFDLSYDPGNVIDVDDGRDLIRLHLLALRHPDLIEGLEELQRFSKENWEYLHMPEAEAFLNWHLKTSGIRVTAKDGELIGAEKFIGKAGLEKIDRYAAQLRAFRDLQESKCA